MATFTPAQINTLPHLAGTSSPNGYTNGACLNVGILPTDFPTLAAYQAGTADRPLPGRRQPAPDPVAGHADLRHLDPLIGPSSPTPAVRGRAWDQTRSNGFDDETDMFGRGTCRHAAVPGRAAAQTLAAIRAAASSRLRHGRRQGRLER